MHEFALITKYVFFDTFFEITNKFTAENMNLHFLSVSVLIDWINREHKEIQDMKLL